MRSGLMSTDGFDGANNLPSESMALRLVNWLTERGIEGVPPLCSAEALAGQYLADHCFQHHGDRIDSLIRWEVTKNATTGFLTGLGGLPLLPVAIPAAFGASWVVQARMSAAIARISGYDIHDDRVRTFVLVCLVGDSLANLFKQAGIQIGKGLARGVLNRVPGRLLIEINKQVGFRLLTKAGQTGAVNLVKWVPFVGGVVGGTVDGWYCRAVGRRARALFYHPECVQG
jgi:hypothetical protein